MISKKVLIIYVLKLKQSFITLSIIKIPEFNISNPNFEAAAEFKFVPTLMQLMPDKLSEIRDKPRLRAADEKFILLKPFTTWIVLNF